MARIKALEDEHKKLKQKHDYIAYMAVRLEASKAKKVAEIASLKRWIAVDKALHEANVKKAQKVAKRKLAKKLHGTPCRHMILFQTKCSTWASFMLAYESGSPHLEK